MTRRFITVWIVAVAIHPAHAQQRLNLVSIVTDDQSSWSLGCYGNRESRTPNMDRLAKEGARFLNAFTVTPVCSPSRASFMTGLYGTQVGITDWIAPAEAQRGVGLPVGVTTWPEVLQKSGYTTGLFGKWHLGDQPQFHPTKRWFNHFFGFLGGGNTPMNPTLEQDGTTKQFTGALPDLLTDDAMKFVETNKAKPFAALIHFRAPHLPYGPVPAEDSAPFFDLDPTIPDVPGLDRAQVKTFTRNYYASIHSVDRNLGRLFAKLEALGLWDKTIVMFTSDHGYNLGHHGIHTKGNGFSIAGGVNGPRRPNMWDTSLRIPLVVRWPGLVKPGTEIVQPVTNLDTFASALGMLGVRPEPSRVSGDARDRERAAARDFSPLLRGDPITWRDAVFAQYDLHNGGLAYMRAVRTADWKLVRHYRANGMDELYDLKNDPGETRNLYGNAMHAKVRDELQQRLDAWMKSIDDPLARSSAAELVDNERQQHGTRMNAERTDSRGGICENL